MVLLVDDSTETFVFDLSEVALQEMEVSFGPSSFKTPGLFFVTIFHLDCRKKALCSPKIYCYVIRIRAKTQASREFTLN